MVVITTVIAIYGAVVATFSLGLTAWIFVRSGPAVQAEAWFNRALDGVITISLDTWNTGRQSVKIDVGELLLIGGTKSGLVPSLALEWEGPESPMMLDAHSGETWIAHVPKLSDNPTFLAAVRSYLSPTTSKLGEPIELCICLEVGGSRIMKVPLRDFQKHFPHECNPLRPGQIDDISPETAS